MGAKRGLGMQRQLCGISDKFDEVNFRFHENNLLQVDLIIGQFTNKTSICVPIFVAE